MEGQSRHPLVVVTLYVCEGFPARHGPQPYGAVVGARGQRHAVRVIEVYLRVELDAAAVGFVTWRVGHWDHF